MEGGGHVGGIADFRRDLGGSALRDDRVETAVVLALEVAVNLRPVPAAPWRRLGRAPWVACPPTRRLSRRP